MSRQFEWILAAELLAGSTSLAQDRQTEKPKEKDRQSRDSRPDWKWWINPEHRKELEITDEQSKQIDGIFESMFPKQRAMWREEQKLEPEISRMLKDGVADVPTVTTRVEYLERLRADRHVLRAIMLYRMHLVLTPEQRTKLEQFRRRRDDENRRRRDDRHH